MLRRLRRHEPAAAPEPIEPFEVIYEQGKRGRWRFTIRVGGKALAVSVVRGFATLEKAADVVGELFHTSERELVTRVVELKPPEDVEDAS